MKTCLVFAAAGLAVVTVLACSKSAISPESTGVQTAGTGGTSGASGAGVQTGGTSGQAGVGGDAGVGGGAGGGGSSGAAGAAGGQAGAGGAAGAAGGPSKLAFAAPDIVEYGVRQAHCLLPVTWNKDGRMDLVTVHDWTPGYAPSDEYKGYFDRWRIVNGKLTVVTGPVSLEASPGAQVQVGGCATTDLDHDGVVEIATGGGHWIRPGVPIGSATFFSGFVFDLDADGVWEKPILSTDGKTLAGAVIGSKDGVAWTLGAVVYSVSMPFLFANWHTGDFDGDGRDDLALHDKSGSSGVQLLRSAPGGPHLLPPTTVLEDFTGAISADMNGDGRADLVGRGKKGYQVAISDGKGGFTAQLLFPLSAVEGLASSDGFSVGDVSGDGRPDLVLDSPAGVYILESDGVGTWKPVRLAIEWKHADMGTDLGSLHMLRILDMDGDGKNDVVAQRDFSLVVFRNISP